MKPHGSWSSGLRWRTAASRDLATSPHLTIRSRCDSLGLTSRSERPLTHLSEPVTALTDYAAALVSFGFAFAMYRRIGPGNKVVAWFWCAAFLASSAAAIAGGTFHGFAGTLARGALDTLWNLAIFLVGGTTAFVTAAIHSAHVRRVDGTVTWLAAAIGVTIVGLLVQQSDFPRTATFNHNDAYHLIQIVGLSLFFRCALTTRDRGSFTATVNT